MDSSVGQVSQADLSARQRHPTSQGPGICTDRTPFSSPPQISRAAQSLVPTLWHPARRSTWHKLFRGAGFSFGVGLGHTCKERQAGQAFAPSPDELAVPAAVLLVDVAGIAIRLVILFIGRATAR